MKGTRHLGLTTADSARGGGGRGGGEGRGGEREGRGGEGEGGEREGRGRGGEGREREGRGGEGRGRADGLCVCMCIRMCWNGCVLSELMSL